MLSSIFSVNVTEYCPLNLFYREKEKIWLIPMTKPLIPQKIQKSIVTTQKRHQNFDYITIGKPNKGGQFG